MKIFNLLLSTLFIVTVSSCSFKTTIVKEEIKEDTKEYSIDVTESFIDSKDIQNYRLIEPVNSRMGEIIDSLVYETKSNAITLSSRRKRTTTKCKLITTDTVFIASQKIISTRITAFMFKGSGSGTTNFYGINYRPETGRYLGMGDIFDLTKKEQIDELIKKYFQNEKNCFNKTPTFDTATVVNVGKTAIYFSYNQNVLGGNDCGSAVVVVPIGELKNYLKL